MTETKLGLLLSYGSFVITILVSFIFTPLIVRLLGQSQYGLFQLIGAFVGYLAILDLGMSTVITKFVAEYKERGDEQSYIEFLFHTTIMYVFLSLLLLGIGFVLYFFLDRVFGSSLSKLELETAKKMFLWLIVGQSITLFSQIYTGALIGHKKFVFVKIVHLLRTLLTKGVSIVVILFGSLALGVTISNVFVNVLYTIVVILYGRKFIKIKVVPIRLSVFKYILGYTSFLFISAIISQIYWKLDELLIGMKLNTSYVAIYAVAMSIFALIRNLSSSINVMLLPNASKLFVKKSNVKTIVNYFTRTSRVIMILYSIIFIGFMLYGEKFIYYWVGRGYEESYYIVVILMIGFYFPIGLLPSENLFKAYNYLKMYTLIFLFSAILNIFFTWILIDELGVLGAAMSTSATVLLFNGLVVMSLLKRKFQFNIIKVLKEIFLDIILVSTIVFVFSMVMFKTFSEKGLLEYLSSIFMTSLLYFSIIILFALSPYEKEIMARLVSKLKRIFLRKDIK